MAKLFGRGRGLEYLSQQEILDWHQYAIQLLETVGAQVTWEPALRLLEDSGCDVDRSRNIVRMPGYLVEKAIRLAPGQIGRAHV
jgi:trimethylamine--corrinoid protein Co-methyltransferase